MQLDADIILPLTLFLSVCLVSLILPIRVRMLIAFIVMTRCFDLLPPIVKGVDLWDCGVVYFLFSSMPLLLSRTREVQDTPLYVSILRVFHVWLVACLVWSLVGYGYPWLHTLKVARQMVLGYLSMFVLFRLFSTDEQCLQFFIRWLYRIVFALLPLCIVQNMFKVQILFGLYREYGSATRSLPVFLPIALFYLWVILSRYISDQRIRLHEAVFALMVLIVTATTYTRGIYLSVIAVFMLLIANLAYDRLLSMRRLSIGVLAVALCLPLLVYGGYLDNVIGRFSSGVSLLVSADRVERGGRDVDSFTGRIALARERFGLVMEHNPVVGLGFIHEEDVPKGLRNSLKYGSVIMTPKYVERYRSGYPYVLALYSADVGWANLVLMTGFVGIAIFILFLGMFFCSYYRPAVISARYYHYRLAFFLQTVMLAMLMLNGDTFVAKLQIACFMIAGYAVATCRGKLGASLAVEGVKPAWR